MTPEIREVVRALLMGLMVPKVPGLDNVPSNATQQEQDFNDHIRLQRLRYIADKIIRKAEEEA